MLISETYRELNATLHRTNPYFGAKSDGVAAEYVRKLMQRLKTDDVLDYGCGKAKLSGFIPSIKNYDPAIPEYASNPEPADIVVCRDVMEHVEDECIEDVLLHIRSLTRKTAYFLIVYLPSGDILPDGRNAHVSIHEPDWWLKRIGKHFRVRESHTKRNKELYITCE